MAIIALIAIAFGLLHFLSKASVNWGHHFSFENMLGIEIDSLEITVGTMATMLHASAEGTIEGNIQVPEKGYPHAVTIKIFNRGEPYVQTADPFDCFNCDGDHRYILRESGAEYQFLN